MNPIAKEPELHNRQPKHNEEEQEGHRRRVAHGVGPLVNVAKDVDGNRQRGIKRTTGLATPHARPPREDVDGVERLKRADGVGDQEEEGHRGHQWPDDTAHNGGGVCTVDLGSFQHFFGDACQPGQVDHNVVAQRRPDAVDDDDDHGCAWACRQVGPEIQIFHPQCKEETFGKGQRIFEPGESGQPHTIEERVDDADACIEHKAEDKRDRRTVGDVGEKVGRAQHRPAAAHPHEEQERQNEGEEDGHRHPADGVVDGHQQCACHLTGGQFVVVVQGDEAIHKEAAEVFQPHKADRSYVPAPEADPQVKEDRPDLEDNEDDQGRQHIEQTGKTTRTPCIASKTIEPLPGSKLTSHTHAPI